MFEYTKRENSIKISKSIKGTTEFTYTPTNDTDDDNGAIIAAVYPDGSYGEKISIFMAPKFSGVDDILVNKILSFVVDKGIEEISECLYTTDLTEVITAHSIQTGYYDDPTGIGIE